MKIEDVDNAILESELNGMAKKLFEVFGNVISERRKYYDKNDVAPSPSSVNEIIDKYANYNAGIAGVAGLVPGPLGFISAVPEIVLVVRNQLALIYDLYYHLTGGKHMNREAMLLVFVQSDDAYKQKKSSTPARLQIHPVSDEVFKKILLILSFQILQRIGRSIICRWLPLLGAAALALWTRYTTRTTGEKAKAIVSNTFEILNDKIEEIPESVNDTINSPSEEAFHFPIEDFISGKKVNIVKYESENLDALKIASMIKLMHIDGEAHKNELDYIANIIEICNISQKEKQDLKIKLNNTDWEVDVSSFVDKKDDALSLLIDLVTLAKQDEVIHEKEREYILAVAKQINIPEQIYKDMI